MSVFKNILKVSSATIGSRILGFIRDATTMAYLGLSAVSAAYTFAFTLPNLFRRLLGEGALTSAMVPIFAQIKESEGDTAAFSFLNKILTRAGILLLGLSIIGMLIAGTVALFTPADTPERFLLGANYTVVMMPYLILICLAAIFSGALNVMGSFGVPSIGPMLLNISIICGIFAGTYFSGSDAEKVGYWLCGAWLLGGSLQLLLPALWARKMGWRFRLDFNSSPALSELYALFVPALVGAAVLQINIFVSKILALALNDTAIPALYISSRLLEFPLGVFTIAIATVFFPKLAALNATCDEVKIRKEYSNGFLLTLIIALPATLGLIIFAKDILTVLFEWGLFNGRDVDICIPVVIAASLGLPFFSIATFATRGFHSAKDTKTPVVVSLWSFVANIILSIALMFPFGAAGLAGANAASAALQAYLLMKKLGKKYGKLGISKEILKIALSTLAMVATALIFRMGISEYFDGKMLALLVCVVIIPLSATIYFVFLKIFKSEQADILYATILRKRISKKI